MADYWNQAKCRIGAFNSTETHPRNYIHLWVVITRFLLLSLTAALYLTETPTSNLWVKIAVTMAMTVEALLATNLYTIGGKGNYLLGIILAETIGITFMIMPTGGVESPFVWYGLNPVIAAAVYLPMAVPWCDLILFLGSGVLVSSIYPGINGSIAAFLYRQLSTLLVFVFVTVIFQICARFFDSLCAANAKLAAANEINRRVLSYISSLELALESFSAQHDRSQLTALLARYACLSGYQSACILVLRDNQDKNLNPSISIPTVGIDTLTQEHWQKELDRLMHMKSRPVMISAVEHHRSLEIIAVPIESLGERFGFLACVAPASGKNEDIIKWLQILSELGGITLERMKNEDLCTRLLIQQEQNRIANEMHDGVAQYLFGIVCALHTLAHQKAHLQDSYVQTQLHTIEQAANHAAREMRSSIYSISPYKRGESLFIDSLASYLDEVGQLNGIQVDLSVTGNENALTPALSKSLHRIVREACGNAIRHGRCQSLKVRIWISHEQTVLEIEDDGCGYSTSSGFSKGLGIHNMNQMVLGFNGHLEISSIPEHHTMVRCTIPGEYQRRWEQSGGFCN